MGFDELVHYVEDFLPEKVEAITGVPAATMLALARTIATTPTGLRLYTGLEYSNCGVQSIRAVNILWALAGKLDVPGGLLIDEKPEKLASSVLAEHGYAAYPEYTEPVEGPWLIRTFTVSIRLSLIPEPVFILPFVPSTLTYLG